MCKVELFSLDKLDFPKLCAHVAQYRLKCGISVEDHQSWWDQYLQDLGPCTVFVTVSQSGG